jgi:hypothetical protein
MGEEAEYRRGSRAAGEEVAAVDEAESDWAKLDGVSGETRSGTGFLICLSSSSVVTPSLQETTAMSSQNGRAQHSGLPPVFLRSSLLSLHELQTDCWVHSLV